VVRNSKYREINEKGANSKTYNAWRDMNRRCYEKTHHKYSQYGARGIKVCPRWRHDNPKGYINFFNDMGVPSEDRSLDRINNNQNYTPKNCRWADASTQMKNRRKFASLGSFTAQELAKFLSSQNDTYILEVLKHLKRKR
jgi:hypothetical protein